jgi:sulfotransferase family protein
MFAFRPRTGRRDHGRLEGHPAGEAQPKGPAERDPRNCPSILDAPDISSNVWRLRQGPQELATAPATPPASAAMSNNERLRAIFILSAKSSGSSALQQRIAALSGARTLPHTPNWENETLYWTKAASALRLPQFKLPNSEVPLGAAKASAQLRGLLTANLSQFDGPLVTESNFFQAWSQLVRHYRPILVEKSPHHLYQPAVLNLMERYADTASDISVSIVGLVRNPIATMYSSWRRFGISPYVEEPHWTRAYNSLAAFAKRRPDLLTILRYEDLVTSDQTLVKALDLQDRPQHDMDQTKFRGDSIEKWRSDLKFGYRPAAQVIELAMTYGYALDDLHNRNSGPWFLHRVMRTATYGTIEKLPNSVSDPIRLLGTRLRGAAKRLGTQPSRR